MSNLTAISRPYAKALFEIAVEGNQLKEWSQILLTLARTIHIADVLELIDNPAVEDKVKQEIFEALFHKATLDETCLQRVKCFIALLIENKRLLLLSDIYTQFEKLRADHDKMLSAQVITAAALTDKQQQQLIDALSKRLNRRISLDIKIDKSLIGGAVIRAGNLVIDGSVAEKINTLKAHLAA